MAGYTPEGAHLVGSVPLSNAGEVFDVLGTTLGRWLRRIPDGETDDETGRRSLYVGYQRPVFADHPLFEVGPMRPEQAIPTAAIAPKPGVTAADLAFGDLGYATNALRSFELFDGRQRSGKLPPHLRFEVCLPVPIESLVSLVAPEAHALVEPAYEAAMNRELARILEGVPHQRLAIQWDICNIIWMWEGWVPAQLASDHPSLKRALVDRVARMSHATPPEVQMGYHFCYGDWNHRHLKEPGDTAVMAELATELTAAVERRVDWLHLPVPIERTDAAYFDPLARATLRPETELYLGLVHFRDGVDGTRKRIDTAASVLQRPFGVAAECGLGRRPAERGGAPDTLADLLKVHAEVSRPVV
ncbi:MAG: hypothetical protein JOZ39_01615 [Chloroflexi bacterium]|nr:hypothetical protein [Chloroflexota bacterium]